MITLTDEERQFAADNHNLILSFLKKRSLPIWESDPYNAEDWYGTAAIGFCKAVATFDASKGAHFSTYAFQCMNNEVIHRYSIMNAQNKIPSNMILSGDFNASQDEDNECTLFDMIASPNYSEEYLVMKVDFERQLSKEKDRNQVVLQMLASGYNLEETGKAVGITRERARQIKVKFLERISYDK